MTSGNRTRTPREIAAIQEQLQLLADNPQLRDRLGHGRVSTRAPYADSCRPNDPHDPSQRYVGDYSNPNRDRQRNYATGLL